MTSHSIGSGEPQGPIDEQAGSARRPDIQGLRAIAVLMVVAFHAGFPFPGGFVGVDVFFVISGFVITAMLRREWLATGRIDFTRFYSRRLKRLSPALALTLSTTAILSILVVSPFGAQQITAATAIGAALFSANFAIARTTGGYFDAPAETNPLLNTWSLSVEEQFYLCFPGLLALGWRLANRAPLRGAPVALVGGVAIVSFGIALLGSSALDFPGSEMVAGFYSPFSRAWEFAVGGLLAMAVSRRPVQSGPLASTLGFAGMGSLVASLWLIGDRTPFPGAWTLLPVAGTLLLLAAGSDQENAASRVLATRPLVMIGDWSYSIYLWHWPLIVFATLIWPESESARVAASVLSLAPALASYGWIEQPLRSAGLHSLREVTRLALMTILIPIGFAGFLLVGARAAWWVDWPDSGPPREDNHVAMTRGCTDQPFTPSVCTWSVERSTGNILVAGDSQAYAYADAIIEAAAQLGKNTTVSSRSGCPMSTLDTTGSKPYDCPTWQAAVLAYALDQQPDVVVIANRSRGYTDPDLGWRTMIDAEGAPATAQNAAELYRSGLDAVVRTLRDAEIGVLILQNIPEPRNLGAPVSILRRVAPAASPAAFDTRGPVQDRRPAAWAEAAVALANPGTILFDPVSSLCPSGSCPLRTKGQSIYLDTLHLTREGSLVLVPSLSEAIRRAVEDRRSGPR